MVVRRSEDRPKEIIEEIIKACTKLRKNNKLDNKSFPGVIANDLQYCGINAVRDLLYRLCIKGSCNPKTYGLKKKDIIDKLR